ncbi:hypothetical protein V9T40_013901 [Parthenolecanium corni]|uniref:RRM domain-containing protein n=1 Tax=Parthenolecanium corni TaxID=536013 RepID=A0AAN9TBS3_9HEMI
MSDRGSSDRSDSLSRSRSSENGDRESDSRSFSRSPHHSDSRSRSNSRRGSYRNSSRYRSRSRSRSGGRSYRKSRYSRSKSRSYSRGHRSRSRSPWYGSKRRAVGNGDHPKPNRCLGVFGLSIYTTERQIREIFSKYGNLESVQVIFDAKTGRSRGFCFVYYENDEDAKAAKEQCTGMEIDGRRIRVDFSITQRAHTPTPGIYMGNPTYTRDRDDRKWRSSRRYYDDEYGYRGYRRSPSPYRSRYRSRYYDRSRSRSYSPRRY